MSAYACLMIRADIVRAVRYNARHPFQVATVFSRPVFLPSHF